MTKSIQKNELIKRKFFGWLGSAKRFSPETIHCYEKALWLWDDFTKNDDFAYFNITKAQDFKVWLKNKKKENSEENISLSYYCDILRFLKLFFEWLSEQSGYKSKINQTMTAYLNSTGKEFREARQSKSVKNPSIEEIKSVIEKMEGKNEIEMRDKALFSLALLTGARITALRTLPIQSFERKNLVLNQDPSLGVLTKNSKKFPTYLISFGYDKALNIFLKWYDYLIAKGFKLTDPIFPATKIENGKDNISYYNTGEVEPIYFKSSTSIRKIFEKRFKQAGIDYYHPHTFRHFWVKEISKLPLTDKERKALSQNLGHENVGTTFGNYGYGKLADDEQIEVIKSIDFEKRIKGISFNSEGQNVNEIANVVLEVLAKMKKNDNM